MKDLSIDRVVEACFELASKRIGLEVEKCDIEKIVQGVLYEKKGMWPIYEKEIVTSKEVAIKIVAEFETWLPICSGRNQSALSYSEWDQFICKVEKLFFSSEEEENDSLNGPEPE